MGCCAGIIKYLFGLVNLVIFVGGGGLLGIGINSLVNDGSSITELIPSDLLTGTAILLIVAGGLIVLVSFFGCCGAFQESKCMLGTFFCLVLVLFVLTAAGAITGFVLGGEGVVDGIKDALTDSLQDYDSDEAVKKSWDAVQQDFECCGVNRFTDWANRPKGIPTSCYEDNNPTNTVPFSEGCYTKIVDYINDNSKLFGAIAICVALFLFLSMIFSCVIIRSIK